MTGLRLVLLAMLLPAVACAEDAAGIVSLLELRQRQVVMQQFDLSCGAAALATILNYQHGEALTERDVALGMVSRDIYLENPDILRVRQGFSVLDMSRFVETIGYDGEALGSMSYDDLLGLAPAIVPIRLNGYNHFVVFRGGLGDSVVLADPAFGNRTLSRRRFVSAWIEYADFGRVAFAVRRRDGLIPPNGLAATGNDLLLLD